MCPGTKTTAHKHNNKIAIIILLRLIRSINIVHTDYLHLLLHLKDIASSFLSCVMYMYKYRYQLLNNLAKVWNSDNIIVKLKFPGWVGGDWSHMHYTISSYCCKVIYFLLQGQYFLLQGSLAFSQNERAYLFNVYIQLSFFDSIYPQIITFFQKLR